MKTPLPMLYDELYDAGVAAFALYNPCGIETGEDGRIRCFATRARPQYRADPGTLCCNGCKHHSDKGCTVKALTCKLWVCNPLKEMQPLNPIHRVLAGLRKNIPYRLTHGIRQCKEDVLCPGAHFGSTRQSIWNW